MRAISILAGTGVERGARTGNAHHLDRQLSLGDRLRGESSFRGRALLGASAAVAIVVHGLSAAGLLSVCHPELKLKTPAWVFCMSWCADFEFRVTHAGVCRDAQSDQRVEEYLRAKAPTRDRHDDFPWGLAAGDNYTCTSRVMLAAEFAVPRS